MAGTAKTRTALKNQSDTTFPTGTEEIVAVEHRQFNEDSDASALNIVDPAAQTVVSAMEFQKQISAIGGLGKVAAFTQSVKADMQGVVPELIQTGDWNFVKDPSVVNGEGLLNGLEFVFTASSNAINFSADFDVVSAAIIDGDRYFFHSWWSGAKFIVLITPMSGANYLDLLPQGVAPAHQAGRIFYDEVEKTHTAYNDLDGTSLQIGEELRARLTNDTGATLLDGVAVAITGAVADKLQVELLDASNLDSSIRALGLVTLTALNGADSYIIRFGAVRNLNTVAFAPGDVLYADPAVPGGLINVRPVAPFYPVRIGVCIISDALQGVIGVDTLAFSGTDTTVNIEGTLNGVVVETPHVEFFESAGNIFIEVTNQNMPTNNLAFMLGGIRYLLDTTTGPGPNGGAIGQLVPGADAETLFENFIYVWLNGGTPELKISTLSTPDTLAPIGKASIFDVTRTLAEGVYKWRRYNDAADNGTADGFNRWLADATRDKLGTTYTSGIDATVTVNSTPSVKIATTAGVAMQAHKDAFTLQDGDSYWVYNDETNQAVYEFTDDLASIVETALGVSLAVNGAYYRLPVYGMQSSPSGGVLAAPDKLIVTRPLGFYSTAAEALTDAANLDVAPNDILTEGVLFKLYTLVIGRTGGGGGIWALVATLDNRTRLIGRGAGGGAQAGAGTDDKVRATAADTTNSYLNDKLSVSGAVVKTILNPGGSEQVNIDVDISNKLDKLATPAQTINSNIAVVGETISFTATPTFDFDVKGNVKKMIVTSNVTSLTVSNELPSGSYRVFLTEDGTGGHTLPTPDSSWGTELDNSALFETGADAVNIIDLAVDPDGNKFYSINTKP